MKNILLLAAAPLLFSCSDKTPETTNTADAIATDKMKIVEVLKLADVKGTAGEAFMEAAKDSSLASKMKMAVDAVTLQSAQSGTPRHSQIAAPKKDALDKAGDALDKTGTTLDKTGKVIDKAGDVRRKTEEILKK